MKITRDELRILAGIPTGTNALGEKDFTVITEKSKPKMKDCDVCEGTGKVACSLTEAANRTGRHLQYESSVDFTEEFDSAVFKLKEIKEFVNSSRFAHWLRETDNNFSVEVLKELPHLKSMVEALEQKFEDLDEELLKAE